MEIKDAGLPIHEDATAKIRPRIFLEGNFFVDLKPGTPASPKLDDGDTIKVTRTATPVQLDEVLTALQSDTRQDLRDLLDGLARASTPSRARPTTATPTRRPAARPPPSRSTTPTRTRRGAARRRAGQRGAARHRARARRRAAAEGRRDDDRRADPQRGPAQGPDHELQHHDGGVRRRVRATCAASIRLLAPTLENANAALASLNRAFPPTRAFAREILPGVRETPATIDASFPWIDADAQAARPSPSCAGSRRTWRPRRATSRA